MPDSQQLNIMSWLVDLKVAARFLSSVPFLWITVALTLALGVGASPVAAQSTPAQQM